MIACVTQNACRRGETTCYNLFSFFLSKLIRNFLVAANKYQNLEEDNQKTCII